MATRVTGAALGTGVGEFTDGLFGATGAVDTEEILRIVIARPFEGGRVMQPKTMARMNRFLRWAGYSPLFNRTAKKSFRESMKF
ncbi:hypothetical protein [Methylobacterium sp.]|uniref:hypothetical protein n=1 Tax=Methylobacterium sp. TaxID=409 RepID=UPI003B5CA8D7